MHEETLPFVRTGSRIKDLQGLFSQGSSTRSSQVLGGRGPRSSPSPRSLTSRLDTTPHTKYGQATPPPVKHGLATPPPVKHVLAAPPPIKHGLATPPPVKHGSATPPPIKHGLQTPPPIKHGLGTPHPIKNGLDSPPTIKNGLDSPPPIKNGLGSPPGTVKHVGTKEGGLLNGSVTVGGNSLNASSSNRIGRKLSRDKKLLQNGLITSKLNYTNNTAMTNNEIKLDEPALVKDHIPVRISNNEYQKSEEILNNKELQEENDDNNMNKTMNGVSVIHNDEGTKKQSYIEKDKWIQKLSENSDDKTLKNKKDIQSDIHGGNESLKDEDVLIQEERIHNKDIEDRQNKLKDKEIQENNTNQLEIETFTNMRDQDESKNSRKTEDQRDIFISISQNKKDKNLEQKNSLDIQNNMINKSASLKEEKNHFIKEKNLSHSDSTCKENKKCSERIPRIQKPEGYVGFGSLPGQVCRKAVRKGFEFTLMVVGESGLGKSTLVNSMFLTDIYSSKFPGTVPQIPKTLNVETHKVLLEEGGVKLSLTVVDTPGFGDAVDNTGCWEPITNFVDQQYETFLQAETRVNRVELPDTRVHVCLYFIAPSGHGLKPLDIEFMSRLHDKVNIIPVIGKADACSTDELQEFKQKILTQIDDSKIQIYSFPDGDKDEVGWMRKRMPFAVVGSNSVIEEEDGKRVRGRKYPWGTVVIENEDHCDFLPLRDLLLAHHMQDLKDVTNYVHYENFRCRRLTEMFSKEGRDVIPNKNPLAALEDETKEHTKKVEKTMENMEEVFERKVEGKEKKLQETERNMDEMLLETKEKLEEDKKELERNKEEFLREKKIWENNNFVPGKDLRRKQSLESLLDGKKKKYGLGMMTFKIGRTKTDDF